jgi:hypothetical protein
MPVAEAPFRVAFRCGFHHLLVGLDITDSAQAIAAPREDTYIRAGGTEEYETPPCSAVIARKPTGSLSALGNNAELSRYSGIWSTS